MASLLVRLVCEIVFPSLHNSYLAFLYFQPLYDEVINYEPIFKHVLQQTEEQPDLSQETKEKVNELKERWTDIHDKVVDQHQALEEVVTAAIACEEAWDEFEPALNQVETRLNNITSIPVEHKGLTKLLYVVKVSRYRIVWV